MIIYKCDNYDGLNIFFQHRIVIKKDHSLIYQRKNKKGVWENKRISTYKQRNYFRKTSEVNPFDIDYEDFNIASEKRKQKILKLIYKYFRIIFRKGFTFVNINNIYYFNFNDENKDINWIRDYTGAYRELLVM